MRGAPPEPFLKGRVMKRIFRPGEFFIVPDGTQVSAFLNATDSTIADIPMLDGMSIAGGRIASGARSKIHVHPAVTQVTYVLSGDLTVKNEGRHRRTAVRPGGGRGFRRGLGTWRVAATVQRDPAER